MRYPNFLKEKGTIGFIAPSFGCYVEPYATRFDSAIEILEGKGFNTVEGPNARLGIGIGRSNTAMACAEEINEFFTNDQCDVIISCGGGELMCEDLDFVDFGRISQYGHKWYMGYSDNTNLTFLLATICDIASIYGPGIGDFGMKPWDKAIEDAFGLLMGRKLSFTNYDMWESKEKMPQDYEATMPYYLTEEYNHTLWFKNKEITDGKLSIRGRMIGGCLDCLSILCGTKFDKVVEFAEKYKEDGIIWFLEACELNPMGIRRALWQLKQAGWFKYTKGFIIGRPLEYAADFGGFTCDDAVTGILDEFEVPILLNANIGHISPKIPIISGGYANIDMTCDKMEINFELK